MKKNLISILLPVHNGSSFLEKSIKSILNQSYANFELIIINDGSTDETTKIISKFKDKRIRILNQTSRKGICYSLNQGLKVAKGKYIARMDSDDVSHTLRLKKQISFLEAHLKIGVLGTAVRIINKNEKNIGAKHFPTDDKDLRSLMTKGNPFIHPTVMIRRKLLDVYGNYDLHLEGAEDYDLWLRLAPYTKLANLDEELVYHRVHSHSVTWTKHMDIDRAYAKVKWKSVWKYHYPLWHLLFLLKVGITLLIPGIIKKNWFKYAT